MFEVNLELCSPRYYSHKAGCHDRKKASYVTKFATEKTKKHKTVLCLDPLLHVSVKINIFT